MGQTHKEREKSLEIAQNVDILSVADALGMGLERSGRTYQWSKHDSLKITPSKNSFYWNSRSKGGGSIQLVMAVNECSYKEAVKFINESELSEFKVQALPPEKPFVYFLKEDKDLSKTKDYLINERQLSKETVDFFIEKNVITQGKYKDKINNHEETAIVFKHTDLTGKVKGMSYQGIDAFPEIHGDRLRLKRVYGDGYYGLSVPIGHVPKGKEISIDNPLKIIAFEAPIDLMSYYELNKNNLNNVVLLAMNGFKKGTLSTYIANSLGSNLSDEKKQTFLEDMQKMAKKKVPFIQLTLAVDNDKAGHNFINEFDIDFIDVQTDLPPIKEGVDKSDWNEVLKETKSVLKGDIVMDEVPQSRTRLDISKGKLARLEGEFNSKVEQVYAHAAKTNGQPMNDKRGGYRHIHQQEKKEDAVFNSLKEIKEQKKRVEKLERQAELKEMGFNRQGGLNMIVENIPRIQEEIEKSKRGESLFSKTTIRKYEKKLNDLLITQAISKVANPQLKELVESGKVTQWNKNPTIHFVAGLRKVALELKPTGELDVSAKFPPKTDEEKKIVSELLQKEVSLTQEKEQKADMKTNEELSDYFKVEFNETNPMKGIVSLEGEIVTLDLIEKIKLFDQSATNEPGYYKFFFDEFKNGEKVSQLRIDIGDGIGRNQKYYQQLEEKVVTFPKKEVAEKDTETSKKEHIVPKKADSIEKVDTENEVIPVSATSTENTEIDVPENKSMTYNFLVSIEEGLNDTLNQMALTDSPTQNYLTETEVKQLLSTHLDKVEHLIQHFSDSANQLENPTKEQTERIQKGLRDTIKEVSNQFKEALKESLTHKKNEIITFPKRKADEIRQHISTAFRSRLLKINQSIQAFVDKVDQKYKDTEKLYPDEKLENLITEGGDISPDVTPLEKNSDTILIKDTLEKELVPSEDMIQLGRNYSSLLAEMDDLKEQISQSISQNPLLDVSNLQQKLKINQDSIKEVGEKLNKLRLPINPDKTMTSNIDTVAKLSILVAQRDSLLAERDQWVSHPDFLNRKIESTNLESPLNQFKKCDAQIIAIDKLIVDLQNGKEVNSSEFLQTARVEQLVTKEVINKPVMEQIHAETKDIKREEVLTDSDIKTLTDTVKDQRMMLLNPDVFKKYLDSTTKLHSYSPKNIQLIMSQFPEATQVASENKWKQLGYELTADAKPIHVYAPVVSEGEVDKKGDVQFYLKPVYDVSQTTGKENFQLFQLNENDKEQVSKVIYGLTDNVTNKELVNQIPVNSIGKNFNEIMKSYIDLTVEQSLKTTSQGLQRQFEVNAISYVIANHLGLESEKMYSLEELKQFNTSPNSMKNLDNSLITISKHSDKLVQSINQKVNGKAQQKNKFEERVAEGQAMNKQVERSRPTQEQEQKQSLRR